MKTNHEYKSRFKILKNGKVALIISTLLGTITLVSASPTDGVVTSGTATISQTANTTTINQTSQKASINWQSFSVKPNETVNFVQPSTSSVTLNRVIGINKSLIEGTINANGQVFLLNPNGIVFSKGSSVNVGGLVASTLNLSDEDFQNGNYTLSGNSTNSVLNLGTITANQNGYVVLAGKTVSNEGLIKATLGDIHLVGASKVSLNINGNSLIKLTIDKGILDSLVENKGIIQANGGEVYLTTQALDTVLNGVVNNTGIIEADSIDTHNGKIVLFAHGGTTTVDGTLSSKEGFIETSGKVLGVKDTAHIQTKKWLLDPVNLTIDSSGLADTVSAITVQNSLSTADVELQADQDITVDEDITWAEATKLTLTAGDEIFVNATINNTNSTTGGVYFNAANTSDKVVFDTNGKVIVNNVYQLQWINQAVRGKYELGSNIDASATSSWNSGAGFKPLGHELNSFRGSFDGMGHTISDLFIDRPTEDYVGLFGYANVGSMIQKVGLLNVDITGNAFTGGLVGMNTAGSIKYSFATGRVKGTLAVGGLVGALIGLSTSGSIMDSYSLASVIGGVDVGGFIGIMRAATIINCYTTSSVEGTDVVGGFIGESNGTIEGSLWDAVISGQSNGVGSGNSSGIFTSRTSSIDFSFWSFRYSSPFVGDPKFDFNNTWIIYEGYTQPLLRVFMTPLTVTVNNATKTYDGNAYSGANSVTYSTTPNSNLLGVVNYTDLSSKSNAGTYSIKASDLYSNQQGYIISYLDGILKINPKTITVDYTADNKVYDRTTTANVNGNLNGLVSGDTVGFTQTSANFDNKNVGTGKIVTIDGITLNGTDASNYAISSSTTTTANITPKTLTANYTADNKVYDRTTTANVNGNLNGLVSGDTVSFTQTSANFDNKNVGTGKIVTIDGITLNGTDASNYAISSSTTTTANITPKILTATYTANNKVYDGTTIATATAGILSGVVGADIVNFTQSSVTFDNKNVGIGKTVTVNSSLSGVDSLNYTVASSTITADVTPKALTVRYTADNKLFDGKTQAVAHGNSLDIISGDSVTFSQTANFDNINMGINKKVNITSIALGGADGGNYSLVNNTAIATADITDDVVLKQTKTPIKNGTVFRTDDIKPQNLASILQPIAIENNGMKLPIGLFNNEEL